ncbi:MULTISPECIES: contact-dependent growth inhibition system immunity protein [Streptomyces]|uniref:Contact-dependent growth inhibition system immunity protein n=1 Tax=Streptomyces salyersiae TaxID=3075530 RepID=A0ABU2RTH4_9ACTN|nr:MULTISPECIES: contact-dependent growth inhibition system immunity protein [unclassified Streptomyces]MDT0430649.1 contact-dependent growth inhibition system immunity protein [Streptomyces sp. DSM 41770]
MPRAGRTRLPSADDTRLVAPAHALRRRPVGEPTTEDVRLSMGQDIGLPYLLPLALEVRQVHSTPMQDVHPWRGRPAHLRQRAPAPFRQPLRAAEETLTP